MDLLLLVLWILGVFLIFGGVGWMLYKKSKSVPPDRGTGPYRAPSAPGPRDREVPRDKTAGAAPPKQEKVLTDKTTRGSWSPHGPKIEAPSSAVVQIFYATDRAHTSHEAPALTYGAERSSGGKLTLGTCRVSIPRDHRLGELEHPSIWKLEFRENPEKHVVLLGITPEDESVFWKKLADGVSASNSRAAFIFVHGYDTTFEDAARRTAQIAHDLAFDGAPICYSWPSYGELADYAKDENNVQWTIPHLKNFLRELTTQFHVRTIHVIAHSMGNRAVSHALQLLAAEDTAKLCHMQHIVLTAPDIDADTFRELAQAIRSLAYKVTLYVSPADRALAISKHFHGNPRLGEAISIIPGIDTIDASGVDTSFIGHSYYAENRSVLSDIFWLLKDGKQPKDRFGMRAVDRRDGTYFAFRP
jgi:esterase/lipase superfamily enzyme